MNWPLALATLIAIPVFAGLFRLLTGILHPLAGYGVGLCIYWLMIGLAVWRTLPRGECSKLMVLRPAGRLLTLLVALPVIVAAWLAMSTLGTTTLPAGVLLLAGLAAVLNGTLEELFWRGAILPHPYRQEPGSDPPLRDAPIPARPDREAIVTAVALFALWHIALLFAQGVVLPGSPLLLVPVAAVLGSVWMAARLRSGSLGLGIAGHVGINLFVFAEIAARNWPFAT